MAKRRRSHQPYSLSNYTNDHFSSGLLLAVALAFSLHEQQCCRALMGSMIWASEMLVSSVRWKRTVIHAQHKYRSIHCIDFRIIEKKKIKRTSWILYNNNNNDFNASYRHSNNENIEPLQQECPKHSENNRNNFAQRTRKNRRAIFFRHEFVWSLQSREKERERARYASNKCLQLRN